MLLTTIERENLSPELQERLKVFEANKDDYISLQKQYTEFVQEDQRLAHEAVKLDNLASNTESSWKKMSRSGTIEQDKINEEIARSATLRQEAEALRITANARNEIKEDISFKVSEARLKLLNAPESINKDLQLALFERALNRPGTIDILLELFALRRAVTLKSLVEHEVALSRCNSQRERKTKIQELTWNAIGEKLEKMFDEIESETHVPTLAAMPHTVAGEVVVNRLTDFIRLRSKNTARLNAE